MIWNIAGWLGFGFVLNQMHTHGGGNYCEIAFCSCEIGEGEHICTCHHHGMQAKSSHSHNGNQMKNNVEVCYFSVPDAENTSTTQALTVLVKFNALHLKEQPLNLPGQQESYHPELTENISSGILSDLLRPPRA